MSFDMKPRFVSMESHMFLLPERREMTPFGRWEMVVEVTEGCWLLSDILLWARLNLFLGI